MNKSLLQFYNSQIRFLIQDKNIAYGMCLDLTDDQVIARIDSSLQLSFLDDKQTINDWVKAKVCKYIAYPDEMIEIKEMVNRSQLLEKYVKNEKTFSLNHYFLWNNGIHHCQLNIYLFDNPINQHVQGYLLWKNDTEDYIDTKIKDILYKNDYKALALIDMQHQNVYLRLNHFKQTQGYEKAI